MARTAGSTQPELLPPTGQPQTSSALRVVQLGTRVLGSEVADFINSLPDAELELTLIPQAERPKTQTDLLLELPLFVKANDLTRVEDTDRTSILRTANGYQFETAKLDAAHPVARLHPLEYTEDVVIASMKAAARAKQAQNRDGDWANSLQAAKLATLRTIVDNRLSLFEGGNLPPEKDAEFENSLVRIMLAAAVRKDNWRQRPVELRRIIKQKDLLRTQRRAKATR